MTATPAGFKEMTVEEWQSLPDNPIQRNTEEHALRARHLDTEHPSQAFVAAANFKGVTYKVDGHTRAFKWAAGSLAKPEKVVVQQWVCTEFDDLENLYRTFDARTAADTARDDAWGVMRKYGIEFQNEYLRRRRFISGLRMASQLTWQVYNDKLPERKIKWRSPKAAYTKFVRDDDSMDNNFQLWKDELLMIDTLEGMRGREFPIGIFAAALITIGAYGDKALEFWDLYNRGAGNKISGEVDGVEGLTHFLSQQRMKGDGALQGYSSSSLICLKALACFSNWREGKNYKTQGKGGIVVKTHDAKTRQMILRLIRQKGMRGNPQVLALAADE